MTARRIVPNLATTDPSQGHAFFTDVLGLELAMDMGAVVTFASPDNRTAQISLVKADVDSPFADYSVEVADVDACHRAAVAACHEIVYPITEEPWGVRRFFVRDPTGKVANVMMHLASSSGSAS